MPPGQWHQFKAAAGPLALIVDSPWLPAHLGITHNDSYFDSEVWFHAHRWGNPGIFLNPLASTAWLSQPWLHA